MTKSRDLVVLILEEAESLRAQDAEVDDMRREQGLPRKPVMLHGGGMSGGEKEPYMRSHGYWKAEEWNGTAAAEHIEFLSQRFERKLPSFGLDHLG